MINLKSISLIIISFFYMISLNFCSNENGIFFKISSEKQLEKIEVIIKHYDEENKTAKIDSKTLTIDRNRTGYLTTNGDEPLSIAIKLPLTGFYAIHIVGYPSDENDNYSVITKCYYISNIIKYEDIYLIELSSELDIDGDKTPDNFDAYCNLRKNKGFECENECNEPDFLAGFDCDSTNPHINPFVDDTCGNIIDEDCWGGDINCDDKDNDGFYANEDCNDNNPDINPGATEICSNGIDENCKTDVNGCPNDDLPCDRDGDEYYEILANGCGTDCNDYDPYIYPGARELCNEIGEGNNIDENCNGIEDETCIPDDLDGDGHKDISRGGDDCNDCDPGINPDISERSGLCSDNIDQNCDGIDELCDPNDTDYDWYVEPDDCRTDDKNFYPEAPDICGDGESFNCLLDTNCDTDLDSDRYNSSNDCDDTNPGANPGIVNDICNETSEEIIDNNCNGIINEVWDNTKTRGCILSNNGYEEINFSNSTNHCGECRYDCLTANNGNASGDRCVNGICICGSDGETCPQRDSENLWICCISNNGTDPYCADLNNNNTPAAKMDCGSCNNICDYGNGTTYGQDCINGICYCNGGSKCTDELTCCRGDACRDLQNDISNCGSCENNCLGNNGEKPLATTCLNGNCYCGNKSKCTNGTWCVLDPRTTSGYNCLDLINDDSNCGTIGHVCNNNSYCSNGSCYCSTSYKDCDGNGSGDDSNGCEINILYDSYNCGDCGVNCHNNASCNYGYCDCNNNYDNCDDYWGNGCETNTLNNSNNCGQCDRACRNNSYCSYSNCYCNSGYADCDNRLSNGCEINVSNDSNNCGSCYRACGNNSYCYNTNCYCNSGYADCDNNLSTGCEAYLSNDSNNCGSCGNDCGNNSYCYNGSCTCNSGYADCDNNMSNGCECGPNTYCSYGSCICENGYSNCDFNMSNGCECNSYNCNNC